MIVNEYISVATSVNSGARELDAFNISGGMRFEQAGKGGGTPAQGSCNISLRISITVFRLMHDKLDMQAAKHIYHLVHRQSF
jgi:hypothetical protein